MSQLSRALCAALMLLSIERPAMAGAFADDLVQPPDLGVPERGAVVGSLAGVGYSADSLSRGAFQLASPMAAPGSRGPLLANVFPSYSPEGGLSEWGLGWNASLAITRSRITGHLDYETDGFTSPWGRLVEGDDDAFYPLGLSARVRLTFADGVWSAVDASGTRYEFSFRDETSQGAYAWHLVEVTDVHGGRARLDWQAEPGERPRLGGVVYGAAGFEDDQRLVFAYEKLATPFVEYRSGERRELRRRVAQVDAEVRRADTGDYALRWQYELTHDTDGWGLAPRLVSVVQRFASGAELPPVTYAYSDPVGRAAASSLAPVDGGLSEIVEDWGPSAFGPDRVAIADLDRDGWLDLEHSWDHRLARQTPTGWKSEEAGDPADAHAPCRPATSTRNLPRRLARMLDGPGEPQVVRTEATAAGTRIVVCDWSGREMLFDGAVRGRFELDSATRLVDIDGDRRADIVRVDSGVLQVLANRSTAGEVAFEALPSQSVMPRLRGATSWVRDFNGDGLPDLVSRTKSDLVVWYGLGRGRFESRGARLPMQSRSGRRISGLDSGRQAMHFVDVDRDGLTDVALIDRSRVALYANRGTSFREVAAPRLVAPGVSLTDPIIADLEGTGNLQLGYGSSRGVLAAELNDAETGLLVAADDGQGNRLDFGYARSVARVPGGAPPVVLSSLTTTRGGQGENTFVYDYESPATHSVGDYLLGFGAVRRASSLGETEARFFHADDAFGVLVEQISISDSEPELVSFREIGFDDARYQGVAWRRPARSESGHRTADGSWRDADRVELSAYDGVCAQRRVEINRHGTVERDLLFADIEALGELDCTVEVERVAAVHDDSALDTVVDRKIERDDAGRPLVVTDRGRLETLVRQSVDYDHLGRVERVSAPGRGATSLEYDPGSGLLAVTRAADGVVTSVAERDPLTDQLRELAIDRGGAPHVVYVDYDGFERPSSLWNSLHGAPESPAQAWEYRFAGDDAPGVVFETRLVELGGAATRTASLSDAAGNPVADLLAIDDGYAADRIALRESATGQTRKLEAPGRIQSLASFDALEAGAEIVERTSRGAHGLVTNQWQVMQRGVEREIESRRVPGLQGLVTEALELGHSSMVVKDAGGRIVVAQNELGEALNYRYDALGRLVSVELASGQQHRRAFDDLGRVVRVRRDGVGAIAYDFAPETGFETARRYFDTAGDLVRTEVRAHDAIGRLRSVEHVGTDGARELVTHVYGDGDGQRGRKVRVESPGVTRSYEHDGEGRAVRSVVDIDGWMTMVVETEPCADGRPCQLVREVYRGGALVERVAQTYRYDAHGRLQRILLGDDTFATLEYAPDGRLAVVDLAGYGQVAFERDDATRAVMGYARSDERTTVATGWTYDRRGQVATEVYQVGDEIVDRTYSYDDARRLAGFSDAGGGAGDTGASEVYRYDRDGRLAELERGGATTSFEAPAAAVGGSGRFAYDASGRLVRRGDVALRYGPRGHLSSASLGADTWTFDYDGAGHRVLRRRNGNVEYATLAGGILTADGFVEPVEIGDVVVGVIARGAFLPVALDRRGTAFTGPAGAGMQLASPWGIRGPPDADAANDVRRLFAFAGASREPALGSIRFGVRDYDPELGAFHTPDPLVLEDPEQCLRSPRECGLYAYGASDPVRFTDPTGQAVCGGVCVTLGALWLADKAWSAYEAYQDYKAIQAGEKTVAEVAGDRASEHLAGMLFGAAGRGIVKGTKKAVRWAKNGDKALPAAREAAEAGGDNIVYRALNEADAESLASGGGLTGKARNGKWTAIEHVANSGKGTTGGAAANSPWISTSRNRDVARKYDGGHGVVAIDLDKVPNAKVEVWRDAPRVNGAEGLPYHRSIWAEEVTILDSIPKDAIKGFVD